MTNDPMTEKNDAMTNDQYHIPVMLHEVIENLNIQPDGVYIDCTMGGGGHTREILKQLGDGGRLIAFDQDADAAANAPDDERIVFVPHNFRHLGKFLKLHQATGADGLMADLGVSSHQFDEGSRGFSFRYDALLDMRMDQRQGRTAADIANTYTAEQLQQMLSLYGEVTNAKTLAQSIVSARQQHRYKTIQDLVQVLNPLAKGNPNRYYAQVFQAFRIEVNEEMEALKEMLMQLPKALKPGGRAAIITFHSLEDRMVKTYFKQGGFETADEDPIYGNKVSSPFKIVTKKPIEPSESEQKLNPRSRSARLRVAERI
ncbi:MAG: 16S rRNA (cytosine(1402)-N(4))-methyltransferase RsmH [Bacteroidota bacterium]